MLISPGYPFWIYILCIIKFIIYILYVYIYRDKKTGWYKKKKKNPKLCLRGERHWQLLTDVLPTLSVILIFNDKITYLKDQKGNTGVE